MSRPTRQDLVWADLRRRPDDRRPPAAVLVGAMMALQLLWVGVGHTVLPAAWLTGVVLVSSGLASLWLTLPAALGQAVFSFLVVDGFVEGSYGTLGWNGAGDLALLTAFVLLCILAAEAAYDLLWSKPRHGRPTTGRDLPWWHDDDLVELSLTLPDVPDELDAGDPPLTHEVPDARPDAPALHDEPDLRAATTRNPTVNDMRTDAR